MHVHVCGGGGKTRKMCTKKCMCRERVGVGVGVESADTAVTESTHMGVLYCQCIYVFCITPASHYHHIIFIHV